MNKEKSNFRYIVKWDYHDDIDFYQYNENEEKKAFKHARDLIIECNTEQNEELKKDYYYHYHSWGEVRLYDLQDKKQAIEAKKAGY